MSNVRFGDVGFGKSQGHGEAIRNWHKETAMFERRRSGIGVAGLIVVLAGTLASTSGADGSPTDVVMQAKARPGDEFADKLRSGGRGPDMVVIPAGRYLMGCPEGCSTQWNPDDRTFSETLSQPSHYVTLSQSIAVSKYEITVDDHRRFASSADTVDEASAQPGYGRHPVAGVSWDEAQAYTRWLSSETGAEYRLPSEAEWEYAARSGTTTKHYFEGEPAQYCLFANHLDGSVLEEGLPDAQFRFPSRNHDCSDGSGNSTTEVGRFEPNAFGLHDMLGNVAEWTIDCWNAGYYGAPADGTARESGNCSLRVVRGGSWMTPVVDVYGRAAWKVGARKANGIRVVRSLP